MIVLDSNNDGSVTITEAIEGDVSTAALIKRRRILPVRA